MEPQGTVLELKKARRPSGFLKLNITFDHLHIELHIATEDTALSPCDEHAADARFREVSRTYTDSNGVLWTRTGFHRGGAWACDYLRVVHS